MPFLLLAAATIGPPACSSTPRSSDSSSSPAQPPTKLDVRTQSRYEDLKLLLDGITAKHADPFFRTAKTEFLAAAEKLKAQAGTLDEHIWAVELAKLTAMIGDAHTRLVLVAGSPPCQTSTTIHFVALSDGFFVDAAPSNHLDLLGARVIAINTTPIDDVARRLRSFMASETDADARLVAAAYLKYDHVLHALGVLDAPGRITYVVSSARAAAESHAADGSSLRRVTLESDPDESPWSGAVLPDPRATPLPPGRQVRKELYWSEFLEQSRILLCRYDRCADMPDKSVSAWALEVMRDAEMHKPRAIAVDLRRNSGGNSGLLHPLIDRLRSWKQSDPTRRVYALVGPRTFSSGVTNALDLRKFAGAILVGEEPGQAIGNFGEVRKLHLPGCGLDVTYATTRRDDPRAPLPVMIDVPAPMTSEAYFAGRDPAIEAIAARDDRP